MKTRPSWKAGLGVYLAYLAIIFGAWALVGADYTNLVGPDVALRSLVLPLGLGAIFLVVTISRLGWWSSVMNEDRSGGPSWIRWPILAVMVGMIVLNTYSTNWSAVTLGHLLTLIAAGLLVGFNEEALTRGVLVVAGRGTFQSETSVWFFSTALFGLMHVPNAFFGPGLALSAGQAVFAFCAGCALYVLRRLTRSLVVPMALHGTWDFSNFSVEATGSVVPMAPRLVFQFGTYLLGVVLVVVLLLHERRREGRQELYLSPS